MQIFSEADLHALQILIADIQLRSDGDELFFVGGDISKYFGNIGGHHHYRIRKAFPSHFRYTGKRVIEEMRVHLRLQCKHLRLDFLFMQSNDRLSLFL